MNSPRTAQIHPMIVAKQAVMVAAMAEFVE